MTHHYALKYGWEFNPITGESIAILVPAYGRYYETEAEMLEDWLSGLDFQMQRSSYCSIRDLELFKKLGASRVVLMQAGDSSNLVVELNLENEHVTS